MNTSAHTFGFWPYHNPYIVQPIVVPGTVVNYSQPLILTQQEVETQQAAITASTPALDAGAPAPDESKLNNFDRALDEFYAGNLEAALSLTDQSLAEFPKDAAVHEFRALVLFAMGRFQEAAGTLYAVLSSGPGWDWTTLIGLYPSVDVYTQQLRALEAHVRSSPHDAAARFVLAYHYITAGHTDAAVRQLEEVILLQPEDRVSSMLLGVLRGDDSLLPPEHSDVDPANEPDIDIATLHGSWSAKGPQGQNFTLTLLEDGVFEWTFTAEGQPPQSLKGVYDVDRSTLAMEPDSGGTLLATITPPQDGKFSFVMIGAPPDEPELIFHQK